MAENTVEPSAFASSPSVLTASPRPSCGLPVISNIYASKRTIETIMKNFMLLAALVFTANLSAQTLPPRVSTPQHIVVDSRDNVFVTLKYGMLKIAPDGTVTDLSKQGPLIGWE